MRLFPPPFYLFEQAVSYHWGTMEFNSLEDWLFEWADERLFPSDLPENVDFESKAYPLGFLSLAATVLAAIPVPLELVYPDWMD